MKIKIVSLLLAILTLMLSSCGIITINHGGLGNDTGDETRYEPSQYETYPVSEGEDLSQEYLDKLEDYDFGGKSVFVAVCDETGDFFNDEEGIYSSAVYRRNKMVTDKYNCHIVSTQNTHRGMLSEAMSAEKTGKCYADLVIVTAEYLGSWYIGSHLRDVKALKHVDLSADYFNATALEQMSPNHAVYGVVGDAVENMEKYSCAYINKTMLEENGGEIDYKKLTDGKFTWEDLLEISKKAPEDAASMTASFGTNTLIQNGFFSSAQTYMTKNEDGKFRLSCINDTTETLAGYLKTVLDGKTDSMTITHDVRDENGKTSTKKEKLDGIELFAGGGAMICFGTLKDMSKMRKSSFMWEAVPMPKVSAEQEHYGTAVSGTAPVMGVLMNVSDIDTVGYIVQALNAASGGIIKNEYYNTAMHNYISGTHTLDMLDLISEYPVYDISSMFVFVSDVVENGTSKAFQSAVKGSNELSSYFKKYQPQLNKYIDALN